MPRTGRLPPTKSKFGAAAVCSGRSSTDRSLYGCFRTLFFRIGFRRFEAPLSAYLDLSLPDSVVWAMPTSLEKPHRTVQVRDQTICYPVPGIAPPNGDVGRSKRSCSRTGCLRQTPGSGAIGSKVLQTGCAAYCARPEPVARPSHHLSH